ncbi:uncharacterized protein LOC119086046 [Bradysia coprophila]|uniref:uncharacterized protein LOC119086046 n=1 Tax=Bradysia coprophila TaxID=38358 RepID=UPI00187D875B|nr:uncharacterized protein LOC119086046 [Bradysia coprophila]
MASGRKRERELVVSSSSDDESDSESQSKRKKMSAPTAGPSSAASDVENIAPKADMIRYENKLKAFSRDITKAFPWTKFGSDRDAFCYRRVRGHLAVFKRECLEQCKAFVDDLQWSNAINYIVIAWQYVDQLPRWDDPKHNKMNEQCYKKLTSYLTTSLKKGKFKKEELQGFIGKFRKLAKIRAEESDSDSETDNTNAKDNGMLNSIKLAEMALKKIK